MGVLDSSPQGSDLPTAAEYSQRTAQALDTYLQQATEKQHLERRPPVTLSKRPDGFHYRGHAFKATISHDGSVEFKAVPFTEDLRFDITGAIMDAMGSDMYAAEKRRFMKETEALRTRLVAAHRAQSLDHSLRSLRGRILRIVLDTEMDPAAKRQRVFEQWLHCTDDDAGQAAQRLIEEAIAKHMPKASPLGFSSAELQQLNSQTPEPRLFAPYKRRATR